MPLVLVALLAGVVGVLWGIGVGIFRGCRCGIWPAGAGTVLTVLALLLTAGYNHTAYYPSLTDLQSSLTIYNSSSSRFTLYVMGDRVDTRPVRGGVHLVRMARDGP